MPCVEIFIMATGVMKHRGVCEDFEGFDVINAHFSDSHPQCMKQYSFAMMSGMEWAVRHVEADIIIEEPSPFQEQISDLGREGVVISGRSNHEGVVIIMCVDLQI